MAQMLSAAPGLYVGKSGRPVTLNTNNNDLACGLVRKTKVGRLVTNGQILKLASDYRCCPMRPAIRTAIFGE
jgi:hypothetical protein